PGTAANPVQITATPTEVSRMTVPPGDYITNAKVTLDYTVVGNIENVTCTLSRPPNTVPPNTTPAQPAFDVAIASVEEPGSETVALRHFALTSDFSGTSQDIVLSCFAPGATGSDVITPSNAVIQAAQCQTTHQQ